MVSDSREDLLTRVASLYYEYDHSQQEIAEILQISRSNISRLLKEAKQRGLVEIRVHKRITTSPALERELQQRFGLQQAMVVDQRHLTGSEQLAAVGQLAAWYLEGILRPGDVLAISWGTGVAAVVNAINAHPLMGTEVVQMIGSVGSIASENDGPELARRLAQKLGGRYYYLHAPLFVDSQTVRDMLLNQPTIRDTLDRARSARVALVGIGPTAPNASSFLRARHLSEEQVAELRQQGAVGETSGKHFDIHGRAEFDLNHRVIALRLDDLKRIPYVAAVACGLPKHRSILGAMRGGYIKALATDAMTAEAVLEAASRE